MFNIMGDNDSVASLDPSGDLKTLPPNLTFEEWLGKAVVRVSTEAQGGKAHLSIDQGTPMRVVENVVRDLLQKGVRVEVSGAYALYQGKVFYAGRPDSPPQLAFDLAKLKGLLEQSVPVDSGRVRMLRYRIYINEVGEILGVERIAGPENPEIDRELMRTRVVSPALFGGAPVAYAYNFDFSF